MGSLMAGWDSPTKDPKYVEGMRNKSLTKERIEEYWKVRKQTEDEHLSSVSPVFSEAGLRTEDFGNKEYRRASSLPTMNTKVDHLKPAKEADIVVDDLMKQNAWWTRSNWAFLNEPPVIDSEVPMYKYASQHHVATLSNLKSNSTISNNNSNNSRVVPG
ncbi:hypothetical protein RND81_03G189200 [Saponaria officinalis]|uniref:Uncharacterized protein n=1 Tax=Saponaria officinalis TaxID=3572 RepID=A0AAW1M8A5_SAPOF